MFRSASRCSQREADKRTRRADTLARAADAVEQSDLLNRDVRDWTRQRQSQTDLEQQHAKRVTARRCVIFDADNAMTELHAEFDPITGATIRAALDTACDRLYRPDGSRDTATETRTTQQRRADALAELLTGNGSGPDPGPVRTQMIVSAHADETAEIPATGPIPTTELDKLTCNSDLFGIVFTTNGQPLWHGTKVRLANDNQWRALIARDRGCIICSAHPSRCEAHHLTCYGPPTNGGTDIDNLALVCRHEHHLIHDQGLTLTKQPNGTWQLIAP